MPSICRCERLAIRFSGGCVLAFLFVAGAHGQGDDATNPTSVINPNFGVSSGAAVLSSAGSHVFVAVREASGIQLTQTAMVKLQCPLTGVNLSRPAKDGGPVAQFLSIPFGDCRVEVEAPGYKPVKEQVEVLQSVTHRIQYVFVYLHPEGEATVGGRPVVVPPNAVKEIDKGMAAMQKKKNAEALKHLSKAAQLAPTNADV